MRIAMLARNPNLYSHKRLVEAAEARGHEIQVIDTLRVYMNITAHKPDVRYKGEVLPKFDAVIPRIGASVTFYGLAVLRQFEMRKTLLSDSTGFDEEDFSTLHVRTLLAVTRGEDPDSAMRIEFLRESLPRELPTLAVELSEEASCEALRKRIFAELGVIRVFTKAPGQPAEFVDPFTAPRGGAVEDLALCAHRELAEKLKFARVWGEDVHDGQSVGRDHVLSEGDMVELHT